MVDKALFSSKSEEWATPQPVFDWLNEFFHFDLDVCASKTNAKCRKYHTKETNGLIQKWAKSCWMNPPYGRGIGKWMDKARKESRETYNDVVVCLVPARTDTRWFQEAAKYASGMLFLAGRLKFGEAANSAPFPSCVIIFDRRQKPLSTIRFLKVGDHINLGR